VITFIVLAALMTLAALAVVLLPLMRSKSAHKRWPVVALSAVAVPALAAGLYLALSNWDWNAPATSVAAAGAPAEIEAMVGGLEARLQKEPNDIAGWLLLGRSYFELERFFKAADAYQRAYTLSEAKNVEATVGLGEALAFADQKMLLGRSAELFAEALALDPKNPKVLWYSGLVAYQSGRRATARDHWAALVALQPPPEVKRVLQSKIDEIEGELSGGPGPPRAQGPAQAQSQPATPAGAQTSAAVVRLRVSLAPALKAQAPANAPLFVLVRAGQGGGPPIAVQRRSSAELPLQMELTDRDAMIAGRSLAGAGPLTVVARIALSGGPTASSGDLEGRVSYDLSNTGPVELVIDSIVR